MRVAYFSPLNPQPSGIADYSEEFLPYLASGADITLFVDGFQPVNRDIISRFEVLDYRRQRSHLKKLVEFDAVLYHMGNDHRYHAGMLDAMEICPGVVVFHDFSLQDFFLGLARDRNDLRIYLDEVESYYGTEARAEAADFLMRSTTPLIANKPLEFPLNCRIAQAAEGIIVHSAWQAERFANLAPSVPVAHIKHHITEVAAATPSLRRDTSATEPINIASFGFITPDKGIVRALRVLAKLRRHHDFRYTLVGSAVNFPEIATTIKQFGLNDVVSVTGHVSLEEFQQRIRETDIAICLRERCVGATSGSLCRLMAAGVPTVISDVGAFSEFPNDTVIKITHDAHADALLEAYLRRLIEDRSLRLQIGANARAYVLAEHRIEDSAQKYVNFLRQVIANRPRRKLTAQVADEVSALSVRAKDELFLKSVATEIAALAPPVKGKSAGANGGGNLRPAPAIATDISRGNGDARARGRLARIEGLDYKQGAREYLNKISEERRHHLRTKPFYNLSNKPAKYRNFAMDEDTHRHFCDFANIAVELALAPGSHVLDVGCGSGWLSEYFARLGYVVKGIDISPDLIKMSRERVARVPYGVDHETPLRCKFAVHDIEISALEEKFDAVICYDALHHFEDEAAVIRNIANMLEVGGLLFILEGEKPSAGSASEEELRDVMEEFSTLEAPFEYTYLRQLLEENGFAITGDYVSVNGLFPREQLSDNQLSLRTVDTNYHYFCGKKVAYGGHAAKVPDSRSPGDLKARLTTDSSLNILSPGEKFEFAVKIQNIGDTLWLAGPEPRTGIVMPATRITDNADALVSEIHGEPVLPHAVAPGEVLTLRFTRTAPQRGGKYSLKIDLVNQHVCWFEQRGSEPLVITFEVR